MAKYRLRAECFSDVKELVILLPGDKILVAQYPDIPDVEVELTTEKSLGEILYFISMIEDGHVMRETLALEEKYTGKRVFFKEDSGNIN